MLRELLNLDFPLLQKWQVQNQNTSSILKQLNTLNHLSLKIVQFSEPKYTLAIDNLIICY